MSEPRTLPIVPPMPLLRTGSGLRSLNLQLLLALMPLVLVALGLYGLPALLTLCVAAFSFIAAESLTKALAGNRQRFTDAHTLAGGLLFGLLLPPGLPLLHVAAAGLVGAFLAEQLFGGAGRAVLIPAVFARLLLDLVSMPEGYLLQPLWWLPVGWGSVPPDTGGQLTGSVQHAWQSIAQLKQIAVHGVIPGPGAAPLGLEQLSVLQESTGAGGVLDFVWNLHPGTLAAGSLVALLPGSVLLFTRRVVDWKVPAAALAVFGAGLLLGNASGWVRWPGLGLWLTGTFLVPLLVFGAADCRHTPMTAKGRLAHGVLLGAMLLAVPALGLGEGGLCAAVLACCLWVPWLDRLTLPRGPRR